MLEGHWKLVCPIELAKAAAAVVAAAAVDVAAVAVAAVDQNTTEKICRKNFHFRMDSRY